MQIGILNINQGNLYSVECALNKISNKVIYVEDFRSLNKIDILVLPGVGAFNNYVQNIHSQDLYNPIIEFVNKNKKIIGICVGMQILFDFGEENEKVNGLGLLKGNCKQNKTGMNVGYRKLKNNSLDKDNFFKEFDDEEFYFTHSYSIKKNDAIGTQSMTISLNETSIIAAITKKNIFGTQFHPELSGNVGIKFLKKIIKE